MIPKGKLLALLMVFGAVGTLAATGAFTTVEAERTADVNVEGDANALLQIVPAETSGDTSFIQSNNTDSGVFVIDLSGNGDAQLNQNATTTAEGLFNITNNGEEPVDVWIATEGGQQASSPDVNTTFYIDDERVGGSGDQVTVNSGNDVSIDNRIDEFDTFTDTSDVVISENDSASQSPSTTGIATKIGPGDTVTVSMAIEIESDNSVSSGDDILNNVTVLAVNDAENEEDITEGTTTE
jgi:hypothetical protein